MKRILLSLGTLATTTMPVIAILSCSSAKEKNLNKSKKVSIEEINKSVLEKIDKEKAIELVNASTTIKKLMIAMNGIRKEIDDVQTLISGKETAIEKIKNSNLVAEQKTAFIKQVENINDINIFNGLMEDWGLASPKDASLDQDSK